MFKPSGPVTDVEICLSLKPSIPYDSSTYPNLCVAIASSDSSDQEVYTAKFFASYSTGNNICFLASVAGVYCPASLQNNWLNLNDVHKPTCDLDCESIDYVHSDYKDYVGSATEMVFDTQPNQVIKAGVSECDIVIKFLDCNGHLATDSDAAVALNIIFNTGTSGAVIVGTSRVTACYGNASLLGISILALVISCKLFQVIYQLFFPHRLMLLPEQPLP